MSEKNDLIPYSPLKEGEVSLLPQVRAKRDDLVQRNEFVPDDAGIHIGSLKVVQELSEEAQNGDAEPGQWYDTLNSVAYDGPIVGLVVLHKFSRALFPDENSPLETCYAPDAMHGSVYGECKSCKHRQWPDATRKKGSNPPPCSLTHCFLLWTTNGPMYVRFAKSGLKAAEKVWTAWRNSNHNLWEFPVVLEAVPDSKTLKSGKVANYFRPSIKWRRTEPVPQEWVQQAKEMFDHLQAAIDAGQTIEEDPTATADVRYEDL